MSRLRGFDRLGDPAAPTRYPQYMRGRRGQLPPPPPPDPPEPEEPDDAPLVCVRCCIEPVHAHVAWSQADGRLVHTSVVSARGPEGHPRICGAMVVRKGQEWRQAFAPGIVAPCLHAGAALLAHLVRLGRPAATGGPSWSGTALCGKTNAGRNRNWRPLYPAAASQVEVCTECREAQAAEEGR